MPGEEKGTRPAPWRMQPVRPWAGALAGAVLVALVAFPLIWTTPGGPSPDSGIEPGTGKVAEAPRPDPVTAGAVDPSGRPADRAPGSVAGRDAPRAPEEGAGAVPTRAGREEALAEVSAAPPGPPPPPPPVSGEADKAGERAAAGLAARQADPGVLANRDVTVTGTRIRNPALASSSPITTVSEEEASNVIVTGARSDNAKAAGRGDWNACTVDDPSRSLDGCRKLVNPNGRGAAGQAAGRVADGLARAWRGDLEGAIASFDEAIAIAPRSAFAYLNRGIAYRRSGDLDRALADLDRAVSHSPRAARAYYHRSLVLRQRGDARRARADEQRAVNLDRSYEAVIR